MAILVVALSIATIPVTYTQYQTVCSTGAECRPYWRLEPEDLLALRGLGISVGFYAAYKLAVEVMCMLGFWAIGALIFWKKSDDQLALLFSMMLMTLGASSAIGLSGGLRWAEAHPVLALLGAFFDFFGYLSFFTAFLIFPNGRFVPRWTRWLVVVWALYGGFLNFLPEDSPFHPRAWPPLLPTLLMISLVCTLLFAQVYRYRRISGLVERQQTKWVVFGLMAAIMLGLAAVMPGGVFPSLLSPGVSKVLYVLALVTVENFSLLLIPLSIAVAILHYRLWDIDIIINRTLIYSALTTSIIGIYMFVVGVLGSLLNARGNLVVSLLAAGLIAVLFAPLRDRLQRGVNRLMYGDRDEPYAALSRLGRRLEASFAPDAVLPAIVETVAQALKLPYAAVALEHNGEFVKAAEYGKKKPTGELLVVPLAYQKEAVGELLLSSRAPGESFAKADLQLLEDLARQAGVAAHAVRLTAELQRSRERLVTAREEERRRLRRDLHDGVGPQLAALTLELETAQDLLAEDPAASALMTKLSERSRAAVSDIRCSVHGLRPPALDELGLVPALREGAAQYDRGGLRVSVETPESLPALPAAVEVAAYRIAQEALTNVARHARARNCSVRIALDAEAGVLRLEVEDDGQGIAEGRKAGVGMSSMRERAEELGGRYTVETLPGGGTLVSAVLPYRPPGDAYRKEE